VNLWRRHLSDFEFYCAISQQKRLSGLDFVCKFRIIDRDLMLVPNPVDSGKRKSLTRDELHSLGAESAQADFWSWQIL
jgi:hypothetical protein